MARCLGRRKGTAVCGTNSGALFTRHGTVSTPSDDVLVTTVEFINDGEGHRDK
jgi:hypothetical protein